MDENSKLCDCCKSDEAVIAFSTFTSASDDVRDDMLSIRRVVLDLCAFCKHLDEPLLFKLIKENKKLKHEDIIKEFENYNIYSYPFTALTTQGVVIDEASNV